MIVLATLVVVGLAGCGHHRSTVSPTTNSTAESTSTRAGTPARAKQLASRTYVQKMRALGQELGLFIQNTGQANDEALQNAGDTSTSGTLIARNLIRLQKKLRVAAAALAALTPPNDVKVEHQALRQAVLEYARELTEVIGLTRSGNLTAVRTLGTLAGVKQMERASAAITRKGYPIVAS